MKEIEENYNTLALAMQPFEPHDMLLVEHCMSGLVRLRWRVSIVARARGIVVVKEHASFSAAVAALVEVMHTKPKKCLHCGGEICGRCVHYERGAH